MNRLELRKLSLEFRRLSSNLLNSTNDTADINLSRFLKFIDGNELISVIIQDKISGVDYDFKKCYAIGCSGWADYNPPEDEACHIKAQYDYLNFINNENTVNVRSQAMNYCWSDKKINTIIQNFLDMAFKPLIDFINDQLSMEMINRIFIDIYGLQDELTPEVEDKDVTVRKADLQRDIKSLISYAVGCMFGRYSLEREGIVYAGGNFDDVYWKYKGQAALDKNGEAIEGSYAGISLADYHYPKFHDTDDWKTATELSFEPDADNCIPITDEEYFEDDIVGLFCAWLKKVYGEDTLEENLDFIANALGNKGKTSREVIRNYFLTDFIKDHIKTYQKRPIYWLFDSGKQNGFKALVYMHRWNADTIGNVRVEYLHRIQRVYEKEITRMQEIIDNSHDNKEISNATKRKEKLQKQIKENKDYDAKIAHLALSRIDIDLDDGVKVNYEKVQTADGKKVQILAKI